MKLITKNFRLNALANQFSAAIYDHVTTTSGGEFFTLESGGFEIRIDIVGGVGGIRELVDGYLLEAIQLNYPNWEDVSTALLSKCVDGNDLTPLGLDMWRSVCGDIASTIEKQGA